MSAASEINERLDESAPVRCESEWVIDPKQSINFPHGGRSGFVDVQRHGAHEIEKGVCRMLERQKTSTSRP